MDTTEGNKKFDVAQRTNDEEMLLIAWELMIMVRFKAGDNVTYIPFKGCDKSLYERGKVKSMCPDPNYAFVVYHCNDNWDTDHWKDYTASRTSITDLKLGWL